MTVIGFIGSGNIGGAVAGLAVAAGYHVVMSNSRGPETLTDLVTELGDSARAATVDEAAGAGDIVVVSIPFGRIDAVPVEPLNGTVVIDTNNYYPQRDGQWAELDAGTTTSAELLQRRLPGSHVVKVFNNIAAKHLRSLARPHGAADRSALAISGDDAAAKNAVTEFLDRIGFDAFDTGALAEGWRCEPGTPAYGAMYMDADGFAGDGAPADIATVADAVAAAQR